MYESVPLLPEVFASLMALKLIKILGFFDSESATVHPVGVGRARTCLLYTSPSPRDATLSRMPSSA